VWVDQICINQQDDIEKSHQVQQMRQIYSEAETVIAWLGATADGSDMLLEHLERMGQFIWACEHQRVFSQHQSEVALETIGLAFRSLCEREYWRRLWIMQENAVASRLRIVCGEVMLRDWQLQAVLVFINRLLLNSHDVMSGDNNIEVVSRRIVRAYRTSATSFMEGVVTRRTLYWSRKEGDDDFLFRILVTTLVLEHDYNHPLTTDPRDRIFSILHLAKDANDFKYFPDYTWTCEEVFREAALTMLKQGHIDILSYCQFPKNSPDLPTRAPDWRMQIRSPCAGPPCLNNFDASADSLSEQVILSPNAQTIELRGFLVDSIEECGDIWDPNWLELLDYAEALAYLEQVREFCARSPRFSTPGEAEIAAAGIAIASSNKVKDEGLLKHYAETGRDAVERLRSHTSSAQATKRDRRIDIDAQQGASDYNIKGERLGHLYTERLRLLHSRRSYISKTGFVGLVPWSAQSGDVVCIFLGGKIPYVIRPVEDTPETYLLVGEAYMHCIMHGEFMHGEPEITPLRLR
jgi:hypothetical protein